nr:RNA methyltransferase [Anaerolineae bacterium]
MITSTSNAQVKQIIALQSKRSERRRQRQFVIEGVNLVNDALTEGVPIAQVYYTEDFSQSSEGYGLLEEVGRAGASLIPVNPAVMRAMSDTETPQGILAVLPATFSSIPSSPNFVLVVDGISNPGNLGTLMRSAAAARVPLLIATPGTVDLLNPKVLRGAMGAHFRLPFHELAWDEVTALLVDHTIYLADSNAGEPYYAVDWCSSCALIVSEEAHGPSQEAKQTAHQIVTIPMPGSMESLNVAMAGTVLLFEMVRQRTAR